MNRGAIDLGRVVARRLRAWRKISIVQMSTCKCLLINRRLFKPVTFVTFVTTCSSVINYNVDIIMQADR